MNRKRWLDLALLLPTMPFFLPITGCLALLVLLLDGRPVFFLQDRVGEGGKLFRIFKLRTMSTEENVADRRPTKLGSVLRQHGVDELPQLFNVLLGDMSLVGPRPLTRDDLERLTKSYPAFAARTAVPPGITGLPQVCLARGPAETADLDAIYAERRSIGMDLGVLARTAFMNVVGKRRGRRPLPALR